MSDLVVMSYNIEHMKKLFYKEGYASGTDERIRSLSNVIARHAPHILGIVEASNKLKHHNLFLSEPELLAFNYKIGKSSYERGGHDLVFYFRDPFEIVSLDENVRFYDRWIEDIDDDGIKEVCEFERKPLEAIFSVKETSIRFMIILVATKSKAVFSVNDLLNHQHLALANRKRLLAQSKKIRSRVDQLMSENPELPIIVMGDFNDEPGMDSYEKILGQSSLDTVMGSIYEPEKILHNTLWHLGQSNRKKELWTVEYPDRIVLNTDMHKAWLDHIFVSQNLQHGTSGLKYIQNSGEIIEKDSDAKRASDHFPIYCRLQIK